MINRCSVCRSTDLKKIVDDVWFCRSCENVTSNLPQEEALKRASSQLRKDKAKKAHDDALRALQETNTKKPYLRFQFKVF